MKHEEFNVRKVTLLGGSFSLRRANCRVVTYACIVGGAKIQRV